MRVALHDTPISFIQQTFSVLENEDMHYLFI